MLVQAGGGDSGVIGFADPTGAGVGCAGPDVGFGFGLLTATRWEMPIAGGREATWAGPTPIAKLAAASRREARKLGIAFYLAA